MPTPSLIELDKRKSIQSTAKLGLVIRDGLKFNRKIEERRICVSRGSNQRVDPDPSEDPVHLALLAYQVASIEMALLVSPGGSGDRLA